jgi:MOSC domain-containing protein YiiM
MPGRVVAVCISEKKGTPKKNVEKGSVRENYGLENDAHSGDGLRQISLLAVESIAKMQAKGLRVGPGDFAENVTTEGLDLISLPLGTQIQIGEEIILEVTQIGKECHTHCAIYYRAGECVMPKVGIFTRVIKGGEMKVGDEIETIKNLS